MLKNLEAEIEIAKLQARFLCGFISEIEYKTELTAIFERVYGPTLEMLVKELPS